MSITTYKHLKDLRNTQMEMGKVIFRSGCFDVLHIGHVLALQKDKSECTDLVVGVGSDKNISANKRKPLYDQYNRAAIIAALECVDYVVILDEPSVHNIDCARLLENLRPDEWHIPADDISISYKKQLADKIGCKLVIVPLVSVDNYGKIAEPHSSDIVKHDI